MKLYPSILNWSYHRQFEGKWVENLDAYIGKVAKYKKKYGFSKMGINIGVGGKSNALKDYSSSTLMDVKKKLEDSGLTPIGILEPPAFHSDKDIVARSIESMKPSMEAAEKIGCTTTQFNTTIWGRLTREKAVRLMTEIYSKIGKMAEGHGLETCMENYCTFTGDELILMVENCGCKNIGFLNDTGNWLITNEDPLPATRKAAYRTVHAHLKDYVLEDGIWTCVPYGKGIIPLKSILDYLKSYKTDRVLYMALENDIDEGDEDRFMDESFTYVEGWFDRN